MKKSKYKLTVLQRISLPFLWLTWIYHYLIADAYCMEYGGDVYDHIKTWHQVKKGLEKHVHEYTIPQLVDGYKVMACNHEGCNCVIPEDPF